MFPPRFFRENTLTRSCVSDQPCLASDVPGRLRAVRWIIRQRVPWHGRACFELERRAAILGIVEQGRVASSTVRCI